MTLQFHPASSIAFSPDLCTRPENNAMEELQTRRSFHSSRLKNGAAFSGHPSELTCNVTGSRKRLREEPLMPAPQPCYANCATSTRNCVDLPADLFRPDTEIDALIRNQSERMRSGLEEAQKRHRALLLSAVSRQVGERMKEKEAELEKERRRNAELQEKVRQVSAESQMWFMVAKNGEAIAASLRASLEQVVLHNAAAAAHAQTKEGSGDTDDDDAQSCCFAETERKKPPPPPAAAAELRLCRACEEREACVVLLPCRHLSLCKVCQLKTDACPACGSTKKACFEIFWS
ncbi:putative BOI-related E3 ubiquitin-protein ligase 2 [Canna indica]|uniref:BOI-related E3 ubiquitin-protein ligase 2 n=1 Tax=Canna indica TaxID=4628 RepID=A0AAQ3Q976_9LILI|nr:putative BOI-related E3 ubiquitin-protein ligase 2 [Canna indica]